MEAEENQSQPLSAHGDVERDCPGDPSPLIKVVAERPSDEESGYSAMYEAASALLTMYVALVNSGDCDCWNPEEDEEVINMRAALAKARGQK